MDDYRRGLLQGKDNLMATLAWILREEGSDFLIKIVRGYEEERVEKRSVLRGGPRDGAEVVDAGSPRLFVAVLDDPGSRAVYERGENGRFEFVRVEPVQ